MRTSKALTENQMSTKRVRQEGIREEIQAGLERVWDSMVDKHLSKNSLACLESCLSF